MTIAVRRSGFTIPLSLVVLTSTAMLLAGCQSGGASNANQQGTTGSSSSAKAQSTASAKATSGQKSGHASPRIPSPTGKGPAGQRAPSGRQWNRRHQGVGPRQDGRSEAAERWRLQGPSGSGEVRRRR